MNKIVSILSILLLFITIGGCSKKEEKAIEPIILKDILQLQQAQINSFDPLDAYHAGHIQMVKQLFNTLTDIDLKGKVVPALAMSWDTSDGKEWTFKLRKGVYFIDDRSFKEKAERLFRAEDVKYSFERLLNKDSKSLGGSYFNNLLGVDEFRKGETITLDGVKVKDGETVIFKLKEKDYNFPNLLTLPYTSIVKKKAIEFYAAESKLHPIGTGPYKLAKYEANKQINFSKNESSWERQNNKQLPFIDGVTIELTTDDNLALLMFKNQKSDFLELNLPLQQQLENTKIPFKYTKENLELTQLNFYLFNLEKVKDANVRKGINYAINRKGLQNIIKEQGVATTSLFPAIFGDIARPDPVLTYSQEKAEQLLNKTMTLKLICFEDILSRALADYISKELKKYSIEVEIEAVTFPVLVDRLTKGEYDMIQIYWGPLYADVSHFLTPFKTASFPPAGNNFNKYSNPDFDRLVEEAPMLPSNEQKEQYLKAHSIIVNDMPFLLAYYKNVIRVSNNKFEMPLHPLGYRFYKLAKRK